MKTALYINTLAVLIAGSMSLAQAAPRLKHETATADARITLEDVQPLAGSMVTAAEGLSIDAIRSDSGSQLVGLNELREVVNKIGHDLVVLENEGATLPEWEVSAVNEIRPLMREIAANTDKAIQNFNSNRNYTWATGFPEQTQKIYEDAMRVKELVDAHLKLASIRKQEQRIETKLNAQQ